MKSNLLKDNEDLMKEYDYEKNINIDLNKIAIGSGKKVWWICSKGHNYEATVNHRKSGTGCPYCSNQRVLKGYNDITTTNPKLLDEWDYQKNNELGIYPDELSNGSKKKVWWICPVGHSYDQTIILKSSGIKCPICANRRIEKGFNDVATTNPELLKEWNYHKNISISPYNIGKGSGKKIWWICENGHEWDATIATRLNGHGCPYCTGVKILKGYNDIFTIEPSWTHFWDYQKNIINPYKLGRNSKEKVWWICSICNESFKKSPCHIKNDVICNKCATSLGTKKKIETVIKNNGSFLDNYPELSKEWDYQKNCNINPSKVSKTSDKKVWWICPVGHSYNMTVGNRASGSGCPRCAKEMRISFPEKAFAYYLQKIDNSIIESYEPDFLKGKEIDIYIKNKNIGIEYDGRMWHKDKKKDILKNKLCKDNNIILYRIRELGCPELNDTSIDLYYKPDNNYKNLSMLIASFIKNVYNQRIKIDVNYDRMKIYSLVEYTIKTKSLSNLYPKIAKEWDYQKNGDMKPNQFYSTSSKKVWWICPIGHRYEATISHRTIGKTSCPYCASQKLLEGFNDLATTNPELLKEWNYKKNDKLNIFPNKVFKGSSKKVWWICKKGHEWESKISNRLIRGCPVCSNSLIVKGINDITTTHKELLQMWNYKKNNDLNIKPEKYSYGSCQKVWWICPKCKNEWNQRINHIVNGVGCPKCHYNVYKKR